MQRNNTIFLAFTFNKSAIGDYFRALAQELVQREYQVVIITPGRRIHKTSPETNPSIYTWPSKRPTKLKDALFLIRLINQYNPVMLYANFVAVNLSMIVSWFMKIPFRFATYHSMFNPDLDKGIRSVFWRGQILRKRLIYKFASMLFPVSNAMAQELENIYHVPNHKICVFYNAIENPKNIVPTLSSAPPQLVCVGWLNHSKGQDVLIKAMKTVVKEYPNVKLFLVGDGPNKSEYIALVQELGLEDHIKFEGLISHNNVLKIISQSYALIHPTRYEAFGLVIIEAMSVKTPVIASEVGGIPEIIRDGIDGFLVHHDEPQLLAEKIRFLLANIDLRNDMSKNCYKRFIEKFELSLAIQKQADWFEGEIQGNEKILIR